MEKLKETNMSDEKKLSEKLIQLALVPLTMIFLHPVKTRLLYQKFGCLLFNSISLAFAYWAVKYLFVYEMDINSLSRIISSFGLYILASLKILPLVYFNNTIRRLLDARKSFWSADADPNLKQTVMELYSLAYLSVKTFTVLVLLTLLMFLTRPIYDKGSLFTLQWYDEKYYVHTLWVMGIWALVLVALVLGFNGLFFAFITDVRAQFIILNWTVADSKNTGSDEDLKTLINFVKHHRFLLKCTKDIEKVFMIQLLALYGLTIISCCMELYSLTEATPTLSDQLRSLVYCVSLLAQLAMFCFPANDLTNEIFLFSQSLYLSNWQDGSRSLQTYLPFAIMATQQVDDFKAMGLITINKMAFLNVFKTTLSFLTLMRNMK